MEKGETRKKKGEQERKTDILQGENLLSQRRLFPRKDYHVNFEHFTKELAQCSWKEDS